MTVDELVDSYYRKIYKLCLFHLRNQQEAEEILHEIFLKAVKKFASFKGHSSPYTWIYRIAVNTILNHIKRKKLIAFLSLDNQEPASGSETSGVERFSESSYPGTAGADPAELMEQNQETRIKTELLEACMTRLSQREKTAFFLFHYEGVRQKEIANIMKTSVSGVEALIHKGMKKIKACVEPERIRT